MGRWLGRGVSSATMGAKRASNERGRRLTADGKRLRHLQAQVNWLSSEVERLSAAERWRGADRADRLEAIPDRPATLVPPQTRRDLVQRLIVERRDRARYFDADLFGEPIWDMLLDLYVAEIDGRQISVKSLCIASCVPGTTALRQLDTLTRRGLLMRRPDPFDRRRSFVCMAAGVADRITAYLDQAIAWRSPQG
jgi:hypothetical protein